MTTKPGPPVALELRTPVDLYTQMWRIRRFDERTADLFESGQIVGSAHPSIGQEAVAVGTSAALRPDDYIVGFHRSHGHVISRGADLYRMFAELLGRETGYCKGLGGSMHIADVSLGILGCNGIVGAGLPIGVGAGLSSVLRGTDQVTVVYFGDGAAGQGLAHEAMNLAAVWKLPVVFVCENNEFQLSAIWSEIRPLQDIAPRGDGYGIPNAIVDGNDVLAVKEAAELAVAHARSGAGPYLLEAKTYRLTGHSMRKNLADPRDESEVQSWVERDPLLRVEQEMTEDERAQLNEIRVSVERELDEAIEAALQDSVTEFADLEALVYAPAPTFDEAPPPGERVRPALQQRPQRGPPAGDGSRRVRRRDRRGRRRAGRHLRRHRGTVGAVRRRPRSQHADLRGRVRRSGRRRGDDRATAGRRDPDLRLRHLRDGRDRQPGREAALHDRRPDEHLSGRARALGWRRAHGGAALSEPRGVVRPHVPGLKVVAPSGPYEAKGLLAAAIRDDNPVIVLEPKSLLFVDAPVPEERYAIELGRAAVKREGSDITLIATLGTVQQAMRAANRLAREGVDVEVVDPRTIYPLDVDTILASVAKTGRAVVAHEAVGFCGFGAEIAALIAQHGFDDLEGPVVRVTAPHHPVPFEKDLESATITNTDHIVEAIRRMA